MRIRKNQSKIQKMNNNKKSITLRRIFKKLQMINNLATLNKNPLILSNYPVLNGKTISQQKIMLCPI